MATLALETCTLHPRLDPDLLLTAALVHDLGKTREFTYGAEIGLTEEGRLLGHVELGLRMLEERAARTGLDEARRLALAHCVLTHHGADAAPGRRFASAEALALHRLNALDAAVKGALEHRARLALGGRRRDGALDRAEQRVARERLLHEGEVALARAVAHEDVLGVPRHVDHAQVRVALAATWASCWPVMPGMTTSVTSTSTSGPRGERLLAAGRLGHLVAVRARGSGRPGGAPAPGPRRRAPAPRRARARRARPAARASGPRSRQPGRKIVTLVPVARARTRSRPCRPRR